MSNSEPYYNTDKWLEPFRETIERRFRKCIMKEAELRGKGTLYTYASSHLYYGLHKTTTGWVMREWAPNASAIYLIGQFSDWKELPEYQLSRHGDSGDWVLEIPEHALKHCDLYKLSVHWPGGKGERIPAYVRRVVQDDETKIFSAQVWNPEREYKWKHEQPRNQNPVIYEAHVGMATSDEKTGSFREFTRNILPYISEAGYNTIQLMAIQEHPFYGSFGYHVSNFFAVSSRFGTPEDLKELVDKAHSYGLTVIMDLVHSHSVKNINEGIGLLDGSENQYFHTGPRRYHVAWDSLCFDYSKNRVINFLLSNCRYWLEEYRFDGFRFDGVTSMIYFDHGLGKNFVSYDDYFNGNQDEDALTYLFLANKIIHRINPFAVTIAEEMSGMPGIASSIKSKGYGFDYRLSMGVPDYWIKLVKETFDESWEMGTIMHELTQHRPEEKTISYCESHDQALVGDKTLIFRMLDAEMYTGMNIKTHNITIDRGIALHKMIRLLTFATANGGYLNFMGNEFGHPEWIDFPREGNSWSYKYARRQWNLVKDKNLKYRQLAEFDKAMVRLASGGNFFSKSEIYRISENTNDKVIAFTRGDFLFVFNFHPVNSFTDYGIRETGKFRVVIDTDNPLFGGFDRIDREMVYRAWRKGERNTINVPFQLFLYLPARTAIVFRREKVQRVTDL